MAKAKQEIRRLIDSLPNDATREDSQYSIYIRERIERGRREADDGKTIDQSEIEQRMRHFVNRA